MTFSRDISNESWLLFLLHGHSQFTHNLSKYKNKPLNVNFSLKFHPLISICVKHSYRIIYKQNARESDSLSIFGCIFISTVKFVMLNLFRYCALENSYYIMIICLATIAMNSILNITKINMFSFIYPSARNCLRSVNLCKLFLI